MKGYSKLIPNKHRRYNLYRQSLWVSQINHFLLLWRKTDIHSFVSKDHIQRYHKESKSSLHIYKTLLQIIVGSRQGKQHSFWLMPGLSTNQYCLREHCRQCAISDQDKHGWCNQLVTPVTSAWIVNSSPYSHHYFHIKTSFIRNVC